MNEVFKREFTFLDAKRNLVEAEAEITERNGYPEFTASGNYSNSVGQVFGDVEPANDAQKEFIELWKNWHLNGRNKPLPEDFNETVNGVIDNIEELEEERKGEPLSELEEGELLELIDRETDFTGREACLCAALCRMFDLSQNDLQDVEIDGNRATVQGTEYLAGTDDEMDEEWDQDLENYIDECILPEIPETYRRFFDNEAWKKEARYDGRSHSLNRYDGGEESAIIDGVEYFAYRQ